MESDLEIDIEGNDVYESFAVPFVVEMLDRSCAWFEERNNALSCSRREPSLREKTKKWTPPAKKSTFTSRKSTIADKKNDIPNKKRTLSRSEQTAKTFDTTAIKPQNPQQSETYIPVRKCNGQSFWNGLQPIEQDSYQEISRCSTLRRSAKNQKKKATKCRGTTGERMNRTTIISRKLRHLWTMKRQARNSNSQGSMSIQKQRATIVCGELNSEFRQKFQLALHRAFDDCSHRD
jgi:hypothetical protein